MRTSFANLKASGTWIASASFHKVQNHKRGKKGVHTKLVDSRLISANLAYLDDLKKWHDRTLGTHEDPPPGPQRPKGPLGPENGSEGTSDD